jgi:hypothetical protein
MHSLNSLMTSQVALWCTFLSTRGVFSTFKTFKDFFEKQSSLSIQKLSTDNGGEYVNQEFKDFCRVHRIKY